MKATNKNNDSVAEKSPAVIMLTEAEIAKFFIDFENRSLQILEEAKVVKIETAETLKVAENKSAEISELIKEVEKSRKKATQPYFDTKKKIDEQAKKLTEPLDQASEIYKESILAYKQLQVASESIEAEHKLTELEKVESIKKDEAERLIRIRRMFIASLYGGTYTTREGIVKSKAGCQRPADCDDLTKTLEERFPKLDEFSYLKMEAAKELSELKASVLSHKANLIRLASNNDNERQAAFERIGNDRTEAAIKSNDKESKLKQQITKEVAKEAKKIEQKVEAAGKNIRRTVSYEVTDMKKVPEEFLQVNSTKMEEYKSTNLESIKLLLDESYERGENIIAGIKFFYQESYTNR